MDTIRRLAILAVVLLPLGGVAACDDNPFDVTWTANPDTVLLYSLARPELNLPSAFDFVPTNRRTVRVERPGASGNWDVALDAGADGGLVFLTPPALGIDARSGIVPRPGVGFEELSEAPADTAQYSFSEPVPVEEGRVYVVRTRRARGGFGRLCAFFGKFEPVEVDAEAGVMRFVYDVNPDCNDRSLVPDEQPGDDGEETDS